MLKFNRRTRIADVLSRPRVFYDRTRKNEIPHLFVCIQDDKWNDAKPE